MTLEKPIKNLLFLELAMFSVITIYSSINLYYDSYAFIKIVKEGNNVVFDSFNFFYQIVLFPVNGILVITSLALMIAILKKARGKRVQTILLSTLIVANFVLNVVFHPGLKDIQKFNIFFIKDYLFLLTLFLVSAYSVIFKIRRFTLTISTSGSSPTR